MTEGLSAPRTFLILIQTRDRRVADMLVSEAPFEFDTCSSGDLTPNTARSSDVTPKRVILGSPDT